MGKKTKYLLDTDICSYIIRGSHPQLLHHLEQHEEELAISSVTAYELMYGGFRKGSQKLLKWLHLLLHKVTVVEWTQDDAILCAKIRAELEKDGTPIAQDDLMIATSALTQKAILVSNNIAHFEKIPGLRWENWTE